MPVPPRVNRWWSFFVESGARTQIDPYLLAAICDRESAGGDELIPDGPAGTGDFSARCAVCRLARAGKPGKEVNCLKCGRLMTVPVLGHGRGLMQIDDGSHAAWLATHDWRDPQVNIEGGAQILFDTLRACGGDLDMGVAGYNAGAGAAIKAVSHVDRTTPRALRIAALDAITAIGPSRRPDYVSDVWRRHDLFIAR